jgi:hypothetical protein
MQTYGMVVAYYYPSICLDGLWKSKRNLRITFLLAEIAAQDISNKNQ